MPMTTHPTERFTGHVENYVRYRPGYPPAILGLLRAECGLTPASIIADAGSGTGLLTRLFLDNGNRVFGVEPNREMREAGERLLAGYAGFTSVDGTAEATGLPEASADFVTAGQAFHWFARDLARNEFARILRPEGWAVLVWNSWHTVDVPLMRAYHKLLLAYGLDYRAVSHSNVGDNDIEAFYQGRYKQADFENSQTFDFEGFKGRLLSASYAPGPASLDYEPMVAELRAIFDAYQADGFVAFPYRTQVYYGQLSRRQPS